MANLLANLWWFVMAVCTFIMAGVVGHMVGGEAVGFGFAITSFVFTIMNAIHELS